MTTSRSRRACAARRTLALAVALSTVLALAAPAAAASPFESAQDFAGRVVSWWISVWAADEDPNGPSADPGGVVAGPRPRAGTPGTAAAAFADRAAARSEGQGTDR